MNLNSKFSIFIIIVIFLFVLFMNSIKADTLIISSCADLNNNGWTYSLSTDIIDSTKDICMNITADNVTLNCNGYLIDGNESWGTNKAINIQSGFNNATIRNCNISDWTYGGYSTNSKDSYIDNLTMLNVRTGIFFNGGNNNTISNISLENGDVSGITIISDNNTIIDITTTNYSVGLSLASLTSGFYNSFNNLLFINSYNEDIVMRSSSTGCNQEFTNITGLNDKPIIYHNDTVTIDGWDNNISQIILCNANNSLIQNVNLSNTKQVNSILIVGTTGNVTIDNLNASGLDYGLWFRDTEDSMVINNSIFEFNTIGIGTNAFINNTISNSYFINNTDYGINFGGNQQSNNLISNNFFNNTINVYVLDTTPYNSFNITNSSGTNIRGGLNMGGNYWANPNGTGFSEDCLDSDLDGICDSSYTIEANNIDYLPLKDDVFIPSITIDFPIDLSELNYNVSIDLNFTITDPNLDSCWYNLDDGNNITLASCTNTTFNTSDGTHIVYLYSNDTYENEGVLSSSFTVSLNAPSINLDFPINNTYFNYITDIYLNYTATDSNGLDTCEIWHNFGVTFQLNETNNGVTSGFQNFSSFNIGEGDYIWNIWCNDTTQQGRFSSNNFSLSIDATYPLPNITSITTIQGSQTVNFNSTYTETNCNNSFYSIFDSNDIINNNLENISLTCENMNGTFVVDSYGNFNLTVYVNDKAGNENSTTEKFTTTQISGGTIGGGVETIIIKAIESILSTNFSITTINLQDTMDMSLAKDSVRPRKINFYITNKAREPITIELECDMTGTNASTRNINICDYVRFPEKIIDVSPNIEEKAEGSFLLYTPPNSSFGDKYYFNILAVKYFENNASTYSRLSVSSKVTYLGLLRKWSYIPLQQDRPPELRKAYPVILVSLFISISAFITIFLLFRRKKLVLTGFLLGILIFFALFILTLYYF